MLTRRFTTAVNSAVSSSITAVTAAALATSARFAGNIKSNDPTYEDDRWLEAELANSPEMTAEERYARQRDLELMKKMIQRENAKHQAKVEEKTEAHKSELEELKEQISKLQNIVKSIDKK